LIPLPGAVDPRIGRLLAAERFTPQRQLVSPAEKVKRWSQATSWVGHELRHFTA
jgi:hypothetical protein